MLTICTRCVAIIIHLAFLAEINLSAQNCIYSLDRTSIVVANVGTAGGSDSFIVTTSPGCTYTATSSAPWLSVTNAVFSGSATVPLSFQNNFYSAGSPGSRTALIYVQGQVVNVKQFAYCSVRLTPNDGDARANLPAAGGTLGFTYTGALPAGFPACSGYNLVANDSWIHTQGVGAATIDPNTGAARVGTLTYGNEVIFTVFQAAAAGAPSLSAVSASGFGTGLNATMSFIFADSNGASDLGIVNGLIAFGLDGRQACYLAYDSPNRIIYLVGDDGGSITGAALPSATILSNGQCAIDTARVTAVASGTALTLTVPFLFTEAFAARENGTKVIHAAARDRLDHTSDWDWVGVHRAMPQTSAFGLTSTYPPQTFAGGIHAGQEFVLHAQFQDPSGYQRISPVQFLISAGLDGRNACYIGFDGVNNIFYLVNDAGNALLPTGLSGSPSGSTIENSQCVLSNSVAGSEGVGNQKSVWVTVSLKNSFRGNKIVYVAAQDSHPAGGYPQGFNSGWVVNGFLKAE